MIGWLRGEVLDRAASGEVVVEAAGTGVGYRVVPGAGALGRAEVGETVSVWIHHHVREDAQVLYAFDDRAGRAAFEALLGARGVGPGLALAILSVHRPGELQRILAEDDLAALCLVPGVGKKTAARLLIELKSRFDVAVVDPVVIADAPTAGTAPSGSTVADVRAALDELGYTAEEVHATLRAITVADDDTVPDVLRRALKQLAAGR